MICAGYDGELKQYYVRVSGEIRLVELQTLGTAWKLHWNKKHPENAVFVKRRFA